MDRKALPFPLSCIAVFAILTGLGACHQATPVAMTPVPASMRDAAARSTTVSVSAARQVQAMPLYHQAQQAVEQKQIQKAASLLEKLATTPGLSAEEIAFSNQQRDRLLHPIAPKPSSASNATTAPAKPTGPNSSDCGPRALLLACQKLGVKTTLAELSQFAGTSEQGTSLEGLAKAAKQVGLQAEGVQVSREVLAEVQTPAIAWVHYDHFITVLKIEGRGEKGTAIIHDPNQGGEETIPQEKLLRECSGYLLLLKR